MHCIVILIQVFIDAIMNRALNILQNPCVQINGVQSYSMSIMKTELFPFEEEKRAGDSR